MLCGVGMYASAPAYGVYEYSNVGCESVCALRICRQPMCSCDLVSSAYIIKSSQIYIYIYIYIYIRRLFCPQRPRWRCSREKTTHVASALWGYRFSALHVTGVLPDIVSFSASCLLLLPEIKILLKCNAFFSIQFHDES